jgi:hypothetical protein
VLGRPLTDAECAALLQPFGLAPQDKGGGSGLALHVARGVAGAMDGDVWIEPRGGLSGGTRISLRVQLRAAPRGVPLGASPSHDAPQRLLPSKRSSPPPTPQAQRRQAPLETPPSSPPPELQLTSRMLECLMHTSDDLFTVCELVQPAPDAPPPPQLRAAYLSPNAMRVLGREAEDLLTRDLLTELLPAPEDRAVLAAAACAAAAGEHKQQLLVPHVRMAAAGGGTMACEVAGCASNGALYLVIRDVRARTAAEAALRAFVLATSHDLREPCNAVLVAASLLERRGCVASSSEARFLVAAIRSSCSLLLGIVVNVLTARQLETGALTLNRVVFDPTELIEDVLQACGAARPTRAGGITWARALGDYLPRLLEGDRDRVAQTLQNLVRAFGLSALRLRISSMPLTNVRD